MNVIIFNRLAYIDSFQDQNEERALRQALSFEEDDEFISLLYFDEKLKKHYFFFGLIPLLKSTFCINIIDDRTTQVEIKPFRIEKDILPGIELFDFQSLAIDHCIKSRYGIIEIPTGGGKTVVMQALLQKLLELELIKTAVIVMPNIALADQFVERSIQLGFDERDIGAYHSNAKEIKPITVAVINSLVQRCQAGDVDIVNLLEKSEAILLDECHHAGCESYKTISILTNNAKFFLGFSGTPLKDRNQILSSATDSTILGSTGGILLKVPHKHLRQLGLLAHLKVLMVRVKVVDDFKRPKKGMYHHVYNKHIVKNKLRNEAVIKVIKAFSRFNFKSLTLCQRKNHVLSLMNDLKSEKSMAIFGAGKGIFCDGYKTFEEKIDYEEIRKDMAGDKYLETFATQVFDEGIDVPDLHVIVMAGAGKSAIKTAQRVGRGLRSKKLGENTAYLIDFWDEDHGYLLRQSQKRLEFYNSIDAEIHFNAQTFFQSVKTHSQDLADLKG